jgi:hypothetical protein
VDCVVADAVGIEPVSASQFPDNREIIREFCRIMLAVTASAADQPLDSMAYRKIPCAIEQGIFEG